MLSLENLKKPSDRKWKAVADFFLYSLPLYLGVILALPLADNTKVWINFGISMAIVTLKSLSKFTTEEAKQDGNNG